MLFNRSAACGSDCSTCGGCESKPFSLSLKNELGANPGDTILVDMNEKSFMKYTFLMYFIPLVAFIGGIVLSNQMIPESTDKEWISFLFGLAGLVISFFLIRWMDHRVKEEHQIIDVVEIIK